MIPIRTTPYLRHNIIYPISVIKQKIIDSKTMSSVTSRGAPLTEIYGASSQWGSPEFPLVTHSYNHTVLYHLPSHGSFIDERPPKPQIGHDKWDHDFVRMPCSSHSLYPVEDDSGETVLRKRWEIIESSLSKPIFNSQELAAAIITYNTKFKNIWKFRALHKLFNEYLEEEESQYFFEVTLPLIARLALDLPKLIQAPIPLLKQHKNRSISLSQQQISSLLANSFFCTFPRRNTTKKSSEYASYPHINFNILYECSGDSILEKLKCICHYFKRVCTKGNYNTVPVGVVTFARRSVPPAKCPEWFKSNCAIATLPVHVDSETTIEDAHGLIQIDFANKYLGGGVIGHGCVQEEIRFVICPELMISMLFTEMLRPNEALMIIGSERYSDYSGYGSSFHWGGNHADNTPRDSSGRRRSVVLAIDAAPSAGPEQEYARQTVTRDLNKAWVGFTFFSDPGHPQLQYPGVATGNWGCGAFGGSPELKSLIQIMACAQAKRPMAYFTFRDTGLRDDIIEMVNLLARHNVTVGQLYRYILRFGTTDVRRNSLHEFIHQALRDDNKNKPAPKEPQDSSTISCLDADPSLCTGDTASGLVEKELKQNSPDLFSQDEDVKQSDNSDMSIADNEPDRSSDNKKQDQTSRLINAIEKLEQSNNSVNRSALSLNVSQDNESMDCYDQTESDPKSETKSKMARKITDYFSKKNYTTL